MTTYMANAANISPDWWLVDAKNQTLGRLAAAIAMRLRGKHKPTFTPHADTGDYIVVVNVDQLAVTGRKAQDKLYQRHTGYQGGLKTICFEDLQKKRPGRVLELAVQGMLPKGPLGRQMFRKLKIYSGAHHPHEAQSPVVLNLK